MKTISIIFILLIFIGQAAGQNAKIDSLDQLISKSETDTGRIGLLLKKMQALSDINFDSAISLGKKIVEETKKMKFRKGEANARLKLANSYFFKGDYAVGKENLNISEEIFKSLNDSASVGNTYSYYGMMYGMQSKYDSSIIYYQKAIVIAEKIKDMPLLNNCYQNIGLSYQMVSNYPLALMYQQKALKFAEEQNNTRSQAYLTMNIGLTYRVMGDTVRAEQSLLKAINAAKNLKLMNVELYAYTNLSALYEFEQKFEKSYEYAMNAATLGEKMGDQGIQATSLSSAAVSLARQGKYHQAEPLIMRAIVVADSSRQPLNIYQVYSRMGYILKSREKYKEAIPYLEKSFQAIKDADIYAEEIGKSYFDLSVCYEKTGDYAKALSAYKTSAEIADSSRSKVNIQKATEANMNFEFDKKQQLAKVEQEKKIAEERARQLALLVGLVLTLILGVVAYYAYLHNHKANALLRKQKKEIQSTLTKLRDTQAQLIQSEKMASLGELTAGIAHEIQNPLNFVNNFSEVSVELAEEMEKEMQADKKEEAINIANDIKQNLNKILHHGKRADSIVRGMLQHSRGSTGHKEFTDINYLADEYLRLSYHGFRARDKSFNATIKTDFDQGLEKINIIPQDVGRGLLNLFTNAFYSVTEKKKLNGEASIPDGQGYDPTVSVSTKKVNLSAGKNAIQITVRDNGLGISEKIKDKLFHPFFTTKPTGLGTGLGLSMSYDIITKGHEGQMKVDGKEGEFAEFIILLPI